MVNKLIGSTFLIAAFLWGCEQDALSTQDPLIQQAGNYTLYTSRDMYQELRENRSGEVSKDFKIDNVTRMEKGSNSYLEIEIIHQVCAPEPRIIWNGTVAESHPPQVYLFVQLLSGEECMDGADPEVKTEIFSLDLLDLVKEESTAKSAIFHVMNASKDDGRNDHSDEPVSS